MSVLKVNVITNNEYTVELPDKYPSRSTTMSLVIMVLLEFGQNTLF